MRAGKQSHRNAKKINKKKKNKQKKNQEKGDNEGIGKEDKGTFVIRLQNEKNMFAWNEISENWDENWEDLQAKIEENFKLKQGKYETNAKFENKILKCGEDLEDVFYECQENNEDNTIFVNDLSMVKEPSNEEVSYIFCLIRF